MFESGENHNEFQILERFKKIIRKILNRSKRCTFCIDPQILMVIIGVTSFCCCCCCCICCVVKSGKDKQQTPQTQNVSTKVIFRRHLIFTTNFNGTCTVDCKNSAYPNYGHVTDMMLVNGRSFGSRL